MLWEIRKASKVATPAVPRRATSTGSTTAGAACASTPRRARWSTRSGSRSSGRGDKVYASLVLADGKLYGVSRQGGTVVLAAGPEFKELARNDLGDDSVFNATPVVERRPAAAALRPVPLLHRQVGPPANDSGGGGVLARTVVRVHKESRSVKSGSGWPKQLAMPLVFRIEETSSESPST